VIREIICFSHAVTNWRLDVSFNILFAVPDLYLNVFIHFDTF
jgi:hypothetical protein